MVMGAQEAEGAEGDERAEVAEAAHETDLAAIYIVSYGQSTMRIGYMALWGFGAKCLSGWSG